MQKYAPCFVISVCLLALSMSAGCAKQEVVKKDEGIGSPAVVKPAEPPKSPSVQQKTVIPAPIAATPAPAVQQAQKSSSSDQLQNALNKIYFDFDSATLSETARETLAKNAALLKESKEKIRIEGNCDERGSAEYNLALGDRRAKAAQQYLQTMGIKADRISTISYGKEKPAVRESSEAAWAKNRRDEFVVTQ